MPTFEPPTHARRYCARSVSGAGNVLDEARREFQRLASAAAPLTLDGDRIEGLPHRVLPVAEVRDLLLARSCPQAARDTVWRELVARSRREGGQWTLAAVGIALPALTSVVAALTRRFAGDPSDIASATLTGFLTALAEIDQTRPRVMLRLRWAAYRAGHAALVEALHAPRPCREQFDGAVSAPPAGHPDLVLARAVADGVINRREADLIGATRLENESVAHWADRQGMTVWAVYKLRSRAEARLATYLDDERTSTRGSNRSATAGVQARRLSSPSSEDPRCA